MMSSANCTCITLVLIMFLTLTTFDLCQSFLMPDDIGYGRFMLDDETSFLLEDENDEPVSKRSSYDQSVVDGAILKSLIRSLSHSSLPARRTYKRSF